MRAHVDQDACVGCGACEATCPEVFKLNDDGKAEAVADTTAANSADVQDAINNCPMEAITE